MCNEALESQFDQQFPPDSTPRVTAERAKPRRKKRQPTIVKHQRNVIAEIARANSDRNRKIYERVFATYVELRGTAPIGACNIDPTGRRNGVSFSGVEFMADVDRCVDGTLGSQRDKFYSLVRFELGDHSQAPATIRLSPIVFWRLIQRLGTSFDRRGLDPLTYFKTIRRKTRDEQPRVTTASAHAIDMTMTAAKVRQSNEFDAGDFESGYAFGVIESASDE